MDQDKGYWVCNCCGTRLEPREVTYEENCCHCGNLANWIIHASSTGQRIKELRGKIEEIVNDNINICLTGVTATRLYGVSKCVNKLLALFTEQTAEKDKRIDELKKCGSCGEPLSRDCSHCEKLWSS